MSKRALFTLIVAASAIPSFSTGGTMEALVGIQPEVVQEIQAAQRSLEDGQFDLAAAQANLILLSRPLRVSVTFNDVPRRQVKDCEHALGDAIDMWQRATDGKRDSNGPAMASKQMCASPSSPMSWIAVCPSAALSVGVGP
ncbi:MAG: hypothetical protein HYR64_02210 [Fimbriimonas ginsengisoli]|uniref:TolC family protein n=1 Tax=Fimbriimonas ginsengisoli TaxID=1005039 RepID=A0A931LTI3_FIMGI|nr:hypothetical protein [Fimbriimonas ginsengisoli]